MTNEIQFRYSYMEDKGMSIARSGNSRNCLKKEKTITERTILLKV